MEEPVPFGRYLLVDRVAVGGMAEVFAALDRDAPVRRLYALKRILPTIAEDRGLVSMFLDEARIAAQLRHPGIAAIHDLGKHGDAYWIAMEFVAGATLRALLDRLRRGGERLPVPLAAYVASRVADALDYAHRERDAEGRPLEVVHRDVSPANVLLGFDGRVCLIDFGIAQAAISTRGPDAVLRGKFGYMSPEQVRGAAVDRRSDVFALGAVLHEMLAGERLFTGPSELAVLERVRSADVRPPSSRNPGVPPALDRIVLRALAREPDDRIAWAGDLRDGLRECLGEVAWDAGAPALSRLLRSMFGDELRADLDRSERLGVRRS
jgi:serine/threonine protein kinase